MDFLTKEFIGPSGYKYTIREENGEDEEVLSNPSDAQNLMNITNFISRIVVKTDFTESTKLTPIDALNLPLRDRYAILIQSRIFSIGEELDFTYSWPLESEPTYYSQDLRELIFDDYTNITKEALEDKPDAIKPYKDIELLHTLKFKDYEVTLSSGKEIKFNLMDGNAEAWSLSLPMDKQTRNAELLARGLKLKVNGNWETVQQFSLFTIKDMSEMRSIVHEIDPIWQGTVEIVNPRTNEKSLYPILGAPHFFFPTEA